MTIASAFDAVATRYDRERAALVPHIDLFYDAAVTRLSFPADAALRVLDLGAGTGLLTRLVATAFPQARLTLIDLAPEMLEIASRHLADMGHEALIRVGDYGTESLGGPYDAVVSALSIHHLEHAAKELLFRRIEAALAPGGVFVNAEQVLGPTPALEAAYDAEWEAYARHAGAAEEAIAAAKARMTQYDRCATLDDQLGWMKAAGFIDVDCWWKCGRFAVLSGRKGR
ncbi:methyltransferase [Agaricicola taiwanensis]|uniref:Methyltransferase n=1 Tax=Agaricicola taiwanensis TaxID=591372 RepID=A0A8J2VKL4_9RHOB|nr:class I SAM-dependent methyltransferase [Agaricicola taiwanensis]GGE29247.1 methyltransferase [Agaricicola taiwanensis]